MTLDRRATWPFAALSAAYFAHVGLFHPFFPLWLSASGYGLGAIGMLVSAQAATRLFAPYVWGWLGDRSGSHLQWLRWGALAALVSSLGLLFPLGLWGLLLVLLLLFLHTSALMPTSETLLAEHVTARSGAMDLKRYGHIRLWGSAGFLATVLWGGAWFEQAGLSSFPLVVVATLVAVAAAAWCVRAGPNPPTAPSTRGGARVGTVLRQAPVRWFFASLFFHVWAHTLLYGFFSLRLAELGYSRTVIGACWALAVVCEIAWFVVQGRWLGRWSLPNWLVLAAAVTAVRMALVAEWAHVWPVLLLAQALHAITFAAHHTACVALISAHFPGAMRGRGQALYTMVGYGVPGVLGGLMGGWLGGHSGLSAVFWASAGAALAATGCALRLRAVAPPAPRASGG